jgi:teichoic acid transport system permease protein
MPGLADVRRRSVSATTYASELWRRREFTTYLALGNIKARNASTALGLFWWVLSPFLLGCTFFLLFGVVFNARRTIPDYFPYLFSGLFVFYYTRGCLLGSSRAILGNAKLMTNIAFPRLSLTISGVLEAAFGFLASLAAYFLLTIPLGYMPRLEILALPLVFVLHSVFNMGLGALVARLTVPYRDVKNLLPYVLRLWLYLSPVVFTIERLPERVHPFMLLNPIYPFLELYRWALLGRSAPAITWAAALAWSLFISVFGVTSFVRAEHSFIRYL